MKIIIPVPTFTFYQHTASIEDLEVTKISYNEDYSLNIEHIVEKMPGASSVFISSPANPLGSKISQLDFLTLLNAAQQYGVLLCIDEVYCDFSGETFSSFVSGHSNLVIIRSLSKGAGLAGIRFGYIIAHESVITHLKKIRGPWDISGFTAYAASKALSSPSKFDTSTILSAKVECENLFKTFGIGVKETYTNFSIFHHSNAEEISSRLRVDQILSMPLWDYPDSQTLLKNCFRISTPRSEQLLYIQSSLNGIMQ